MSSNIPAIKKMGNSPEIQERLKKLTTNSDAFLGSVLSLVGDNSKLGDCTPNSIMVAAMKSAVLNLSVDPTLGYAYIIPYGKTASFQLGYKGLIQLAIRSNRYKAINSVPVYQDEIEGFDPLTQSFTFKKGFNPNCQRFNGGEPIGYYAYFELDNGFKTSMFMSTDEIKAHALQYSQAYKYDVSNGKKNSPWSTSFPAMAAKTPLKMILSKFGLLSTSMENAIVSDESEKEPAKEAQATTFTEVKSQEVEAKAEVKAETVVVEEPVVEQAPQNESGIPDNNFPVEEDTDLPY